ncbi:conserved membrane protein of unknown function [Rhodovastum atsumiense]|uniref:DUF2189 domain-containing protein n=1 Tax=Rhodovastum atsumiense TaxID=504468 RepID=A0A5M6INW7_9PROT|nr:DUF2189 domain-containing protein [Rhodovastum atsumiense]KAA5609963.1 DUF2189 domain-containing protein [Rhodovastum atsumiense]CAH2598602.1 conserved membrane protein of unknown function [Rhodovastum atsumiense]
MTIRNPVEWVADRSIHAGSAIRSASHSVHPVDRPAAAVTPVVRRIRSSELWDVLARGLDDFGANRTDVLFLCVLYPVLGLVMARAAAGYGMVPLLFPLASGFALVGPLAGVGLYEMSRQRERGGHAGWSSAFGVVRAPAFGAILLLGLILTGIFVLWLLAAQAIYDVTLGPEPPVSVSAFVQDVFTTPAGWAMIVGGIGAGFLFALLVMAISVVSFPLMLDREVGLETAVWTSIRAVAANPRPMAMWGLIVAASLVIGSIPLFFGLVIVLPVLGHATWHLYRKVVAH